MNARVEPHTLAIDEEPFDSRTSETMRSAYGKVSSDGITGSRARSAEGGSPARRAAGVEPRTRAIDEGPFDSRTAETMRSAYGKVSSDGITGSRARSARAPCPISRLRGAPTLPVSPVE